MAMSEMSEIVKLNVNKADTENYEPLLSLPLRQSFTVNTVRKLRSISLNFILCCGTMSVTLFHFSLFADKRT